MEPDKSEPSLVRSDSNESMQSALSSMANTGTFILAPSTVPATGDILANIPQPEELKTSKQLTQLSIDFQIDTVNFKMSQQVKNSNHDEEIFNFVLDELKAETTLRTFDLNAKFNLGGLSCTHLLLHTPQGLPVQMLSTKKVLGQDQLLTIHYTDVKKSSPDLAVDYDNVLKRLDINLAGVDIVVHQNAIMDLHSKVMSDFGCVYFNLSSCVGKLIQHKVLKGSQ